MNTNIRHGGWICLAAAFCGITAFGAEATAGGPVWASRGDRPRVDVSQGQRVDQSGVVSLADGAVLEKTGAGCLVLPLGQIVQNEDFGMIVHDGTVALSNSVPCELSKPTDVLDRAAFWLDATKNVLEGDDGAGGTCVTGWLDCRETDVAVPFTRYHGFAGSTLGVKPKKTSDFAGRVAIDFCGYGSGAYLGFSQPEDSSGSKAALTAWDVFIVHSVTRPGNGGSSAAKGVGGYPYLFGGVNQPFHPQDADNKITKTLLRSQYEAKMDARWWLNGTEIDATKTTAALGAFVFDSKFYYEQDLPKVNSLYFYTGDTSLRREGGDLVHEVILFTNKLTETEHAQIRQYLIDRWNTASSVPSRYDFAIARDAKVEVEAFAPALKFSGEGTLERTGSAESTLDYEPDEVNGLRLAIPANGQGATVVREDVAMEVTAGDRIASANVFYGSRMVRTGDAMVGELIKEGDERVRISSWPEGVRKLTVEGGQLDLSPEIPATVPTGSEIAATIVNAGFEDDIGGQYYQKMSSPIGGWTWSYAPGYSFADSYSVIAYVRDLSVDNNWFSFPTTTEGSHYLAVRSQSQVSAALSVPSDGIYDLRFDLLRRSGTPLARIVVLAGADTTSLSEVGSANCYPYQKWNTVSIRGVKLSTQDKVVVFRSEVYYPGADTYARSGVLIDNIQFELAVRQDGCWPIPNGNFEKPVLNVAYAKHTVASGSVNTYDGRPFSPDFQAEGWTLTSPAGASTNYIGIAVGGNSGTGHSYANNAMMRDGCAQLLITAPGAMASTSFRAPAGRWRLRADLATWRKYTHPKNVLNTYDDGLPAAKIKIGESSEIDLGMLAVPGLMACTRTWDTPFTVPEGGADVVLTLSIGQTTSGCGSLFDNLVLVPDRVNLVANGNFDSPYGDDNWISDTSAKVSGTPTERVRTGRGTMSADAAQYSSVPEGYDGLTSGYFGIIADCAALWQRLVFPSEGRYRISYYTRARHNGTSFRYGGNSLRSFYVMDGVTNGIDEVLVASTNWVARNATFTVRNAGECSLVFRGTNVPTQMRDTDGPGGWDKTIFFDGVRIEKIADVPGETFVLDENMEISVSAGAKLRLDFQGTNHVQRVRLGGHSVSGEISASTHPDFILGDGVLVAPERGALLIVR